MNLRNSLLFATLGIAIIAIISWLFISSGRNTVDVILPAYASSATFYGRDGKATHTDITDRVTLNPGQHWVSLSGDTVDTSRHEIVVDQDSAVDLRFIGRSRAYLAELLEKERSALQKAVSSTVKSPGNTYRLYDFALYGAGDVAGVFWRDINGDTSSPILVRGVLQKDQQNWSLVDKPNFILDKTYTESVSSSIIQQINDFSI